MTMDDTRNDTADWLEKFETGHAAIEVLYVVFPICGLLTSGLLLTLFIFQRGLRKYSSLILNITLLHIFLRSISILIFRTPHDINSDIGDVSPVYCVVMKQAPEYWKAMLLIALPLHSMERLIRFRTRSFMSLSKRRHLLGCLIIVSHTLSLFIVVLPTTSIFNSGHNALCEGALVYGDSYAYVYMSVTVLSITSTLALVLTIVLQLMIKRRELMNDYRKRIRLTQVVRAEIALTLALMIGLLPCGIIKILKLMCGSYLLNHQNFCDSEEETYQIQSIIRGLGFIHKIFCYFAPALYLFLNAKLRRKIWLSFRSAKSQDRNNRSDMSQNTDYLSEDTMSESLDGSSTRFTVSIITNKRGSSLSKTISVKSLDEDEILTIVNDLQTSPPPRKSTPPPSWEEVKRKDSSHRQRYTKPSKSFTDLADVLSVISERSEISSTDSITTLSVSQLDLSPSQPELSPTDSGRSSLSKSDCSDDEDKGVSVGDHRGT